MFVYEVKALAAKKKSGNTVSAVWALAEKAASGTGVTIWDVRFVKEGADWFLRVFLDKPEGISMDDCVMVSRELNTLLDEEDLIEQSYCLEVCSPGINRELTRPEHFERFTGSPVRVKLIRPLPDGRRELNGELLSLADGEIRLQVDEEEVLTIAQKDSVSVRLLDDDFEEE
ncbi:MAG: ribosome maturation factor RimP [Clostridium sp.]|uniref:ribosome maturation factor RimP n=1 Tax=Clostridium sp. TaxID=1506 RepID=UPI002911EABB|nr:ribosome maturation factor RimP [Clostridium sp.]MDU7338958.1 ribosome maturation factor RimP [Clostridium sp.]